jgi:hypothetical protein
LPIAHAEGNFQCDDVTLNSLEENGQIVFRYCDEHGEITPAANPNGARSNIAGICNLDRNVLGMMPHPERACEDALGSSDGLDIFRSLTKSIHSVQALVYWYHQLRSPMELKTGDTVIVIMHSPREKLLAKLGEISPAGIIVRSIDLGYFDDWCRSIAEGEEHLEMSDNFFPMWRVERITKDAALGDGQSMSEQFEGRTGMLLRDQWDGYGIFDIVMLPVFDDSRTIASPPFPIFPTMVLIGPSETFSVAISIGISLLKVPEVKVADICEDVAKGMAILIDPREVLRV